MLIDTMLLRLAIRIGDGRTRNAQQVFADSTSAIAVSSCVNNGGVVQVNTVSAHGMITGQECYIAAIAGTTEANNTLTNLSWVVTVVSATAFTIPAAFVHAYTSGGTVTPARIGSSRGNSFEPQQLLDVYNQSRKAAFNALLVKFGNDKDGFKAAIGALMQSGTITFSGATPAVATKPDAYVEFVSLNDATGIIPLVESDMLERVIANSPNYAQSATNRLVYEQSTQLVHPSTFVSGSCTLKYIGITDWTLTNVLSGTSSETYATQHLEALLQLGEYIAVEVGGGEVAALANKLFGNS